MGIDQSIILGVKPPQFENPLDMARQAQSLQALGYQNQNAQREMQNQQDLRSAYSQAMTAGPDGTPTVDRQKFAGALQNNPMLLAQQMPKFQEQDAAKAKSDMEVDKARHEKAAEIAWSIPTDPSVPQDQKQAKWAAAKQQALKLGLPGADQSPDQYPGDSFVKQMQMHTLDAQKQSEMQEKQQEFASRAADRQVAREQMTQNKQNQTFHNTQTMLEAARGSLMQPEKDIYAGQKVQSLIAQAGTDPNNMNMSMVHLLTSEVGKMASGGVPTVDELKGLTPGNIPQKLSGAAEMFNNHPTPANAGAFIKQMSDYSNAIVKDGQKVIEDKYGRIINTNAEDLSPKHVKALTAQYIDRFKTPETDANTKLYNGVTYKIENGHWVPQ